MRENKSIDCPLMFIDLNADCFLINFSALFFLILRYLSVLEKNNELFPLQSP